MRREFTRLRSVHGHRSKSCLASAESRTHFSFPVGRGHQTDWSCNPQRLHRASVFRKDACALFARGQAVIWLFEKDYLGLDRPLLVPRGVLRKRVRPTHPPVALPPIKDRQRRQASRVDRLCKMRNCIGLNCSNPSAKSGPAWQKSWVGLRESAPHARASRLRQSSCSLP